jgi:hypothetical protein
LLFPHPGPAGTGNDPAGRPIGPLTTSRTSGMVNETVAIDLRRFYRKMTGEEESC